MKSNIIIGFFILYYSQFTFAQISKEVLIQGRVIADSVSVEGVNLVNLTNQQTAATDIAGKFSIPVQEDDVLVISSINLVTQRLKITKEHLFKKEILVKLLYKSIPLKEVIVNEYTAINAENLGIIPYGQKKYTPAERQLYTATSGGGIDGLLSTISGRKAILKKNLVVEKKEQSMINLGYYLENKYFTEVLKIPEGYVKGFQFYCVEDVDLVAAINSKNKTLIKFLIIPLAEKYNANLNIKN